VRVAQNGNGQNGNGQPHDEPYDDGFGSQGDGGWAASSQSWSEAAEASFPQGFPEPAALVEENGNGGGSWSPLSAAAELTGIGRVPYRSLDELGSDGTQTSAPSLDPQLSTSSAPQFSPQPVAQPVAPDAPAATAPGATVAPKPLVLTIDDKRALVERVAGAESGSDRYGAINADGEFKGRFGPSHPAYQHHHIGLSYGLIQFTQESGSLGQLLAMMRDRDDAMFRQTFGENSDELISVTTAAGPPSSESPDGRSARTQPVGGADLWEEPWISRFRQAGQVTAFQSAQNELAARAYVDPMIGFAGDLGLDTDRALAMVVDRSVQMGVNGARHWVIAAVGPISTPALRQQALAALGHADLGSFQRAWNLPPDNLWGPLTHAGLVGALRQIGSASPIPLPTVDQMLDGLVRRADADNAFWASRVQRLRTAAGFTDRPYAR
jgi:hypothetical protein